MSNQVESVECFFDPMCPWAYQTSKWLRDVRRSTNLDIRWRFFSLEEVNRRDDQKHPWQRDWSFGWGQMRVGALLRRSSLEELDRWYEAVGKAFFEEGRPTHDRGTHMEIVADAGFDPAIVEQAVVDETTHDDIRADHEEAVRRYAAFGVPTLVLPDGSAIFGPVVAPAPTGDAAVKLWDLVVAAAPFKDLFELKRPKSPADQARIAEMFAPYLQARRWHTVENPAP